MCCVSVVIPTYKHCDFILQTLDSVFVQTFTDYEVIVVNDGSPDDTANVLKPLIAAGKIRYIEQANAGQAAARNRGIAEANGEYIALLDDDDLWPLGKLEWQMGLICSRPEVGAIGGTVVLFSGDEAPTLSEMNPKLFACPSFEMLFCGCPILSPGQSLIRRTVLEQIGGFNTKIWGADDYDLWMRLSRVTRIELYDAVSLFYRCHSTNASLNTARMLKNARKVIEQNLIHAPVEQRAKLRQDAYRGLYSYLGRRSIIQANEARRLMHFKAALQNYTHLVHFLGASRTDRQLRNLIIGDVIRIKI